MISIIFLILAFAVAITIHEASHAWMADHLGDPTARLEGRLSLNPLAHYDPIGTTLLLITAVLWWLKYPVFPFGWAKPVMFDPYNLARPRRDAALISLAGPAANLALATVLGIINRLLITNPFSPFYIFSSLTYFLIVLNVSLAIFNLIPIHPLDGGKILAGLLPAKEAAEFDRLLNRYGFLLLLFLIFPTFGGASIISMVISPIISLLLKILVPGNPTI
jgi:Zn-dependent protease